ncbi:hypothetical protein ABH922_005494 [Rhodococcus sp. 27YEA15]|uniref:Dabb family protein n=1 Tax=Rhodococcus sp. 27YEA15 TaxID=3156259 RepID=UPI003C7C4B0C
MTSSGLIDNHAVHFAVYRYKEGTVIADVERALEDVCKLGDQVPGIRVVSWGTNSSPHACGYTHAMTIVGTDMDAVREYRELARNHPTSQLLSDAEETGVGADYDYPGVAGA